MHIYQCDMECLARDRKINLNEMGLLFSSEGSITPVFTLSLDTGEFSVSNLTNSCGTRLPQLNTQWLHKLKHYKLYARLTTWIFCMCETSLRMHTLSFCLAVCVTLIGTEPCEHPSLPMPSNILWCPGMISSFLEHHDRGWVSPQLWRWQGPSLLSVHPWEQTCRLGLNSGLTSLSEPEVPR